MAGRSVAIALAALAGLCMFCPSASGAGGPATSTAGKQWSLVGCREISPGSLRATADGRRVVFGDFRTTDANGAKLNPPRTEYRLLDTVSGKIARVGDYLAGEGEGVGALPAFAEPSPDGNYLAVGTLALAPAPACRVYLVSLADGRARKLAEAPLLTATWAGGRLAVSGTDKHLDPLPIRLFDPAADKPVQWNVRGQVVCASGDGGTLIVCCDPNAPDAPVKGGDAARIRAVAMQADGKVSGRLAAPAPLDARPVISPGGRFVAFVDFAGPDANEPQCASIVVASLADAARWSFQEADPPLAVMDDGKLLVARIASGLDGSVKICDAKDAEPRLLAEGVRAAAVAGGRLYVVIRTDAGLVLKTMALTAP